MFLAASSQQNRRSSFYVSVQSLVSPYIELEVFSDLAASAASVTGDTISLIYAAHEDVSWPPRFSTAVPATYTAEMRLLEASINEVRALLSRRSCVERRKLGSSFSKFFGGCHNLPWYASHY